MISSIKGILETISPDRAVISVGGVGFQIFMSTSTLSSLGQPGCSVRLHTQMVVREDAITLFGFTSEDELRLFQLLQGVSGFGPKLALALLSGFSVDELSAAIAGGAVELITTVPGVGKKLAARLVLELKDKVAAWASESGVPLNTGDNDVLAALMSLGYSSSEAARAAASVQQRTELSLEDKIKFALRYFESR